MIKKLLSAIIGFILAGSMAVTISNGVNLYFGNVRDMQKRQAEQSRLDKINWSWEGISTDKDIYNKCDTVVLTGYRESTEAGSLSLFEELVQIKGNQDIEIYRKTNSAFVEKQSGILTIPLQLPCNDTTIADGQYVWSGMVVLTTADGYSKSFGWRSSLFEVRS